MHTPRAVSNKSKVLYIRFRQTHPIPLKSITPHATLHYIQFPAWFQALKSLSTNERKLHFFLKNLLTLLKSSNFCISGDMPPWTQRNCLFITAPSGNMSKELVHASYTLSVYFTLPKTWLLLPVVKLLNKTSIRTIPRLLNSLPMHACTANTRSNFRTRLNMPWNAKGIITMKGNRFKYDSNYCTMVS